MQWQSVIGLEVHVQLATQSKIFSGAATAYGASANSQACAIDLGLPGTLPVLNQQVVEMAIKFGLSIGAAINQQSVFARKNYFYPDLPKGYQISQYDEPIVKGGSLNICLENGELKTIAITRAHLEEDAGKSMHEALPGMSGIDFNRAGTGLLEVVSEPVMYSAKEAVAYLKALHTLVRYLEICDGNMQEGSFRCDANVSVMPVGSATLGTRAEIKNVNSFRFVERAIDYEIQRQIHLLESGETVAQETRLYDSDRNQTRTMRSKEEAHDYRYFPDPDLLPVAIPTELIQQIQNQLPELPQQKRERFMNELSLSAYDADILVSSKALAEYFEATLGHKKVSAKLAANWILGELSAALNEAQLSIEQSPLGSERLQGLLQRIEDNTISGKIAKKVFEKMWQTQLTADDVIQKEGLKQVTDDSALRAVIQKVINENPSQVQEYLSGKDKIFGFFVGQLMKLTQGRANPQQLNTLLKAALESCR